MNIYANSTSFIAFEGSRRIASGNLQDVALKAKEILDRDVNASVLIFDEVTSRPIEVDFRGTAEDVLGKLPPTTSVDASPDGPIEPVPAVPQAPGRPRLGVVAREVTLLPRHWEWLNDQPSGASAALRKLVEAARHQNAAKDAQRHAQESAYRFMYTMAGDEPGFEEAMRVFFRGDSKPFKELTQSWSADVRDHARKLAAEAFQPLP